MKTVAHYNAEMATQRTVAFLKIVEAWKTREDILSAYEEGVAPLQLARLFDHEIGLNVFKGLNGAYERTSGETKQVALFPRGLSLKEFVRRLISIVPYGRKFRAKHLSQPQELKIRYAHLDKSDDEVKKLVEEQLSAWASSTHKKRKKQKAYSRVYTIEYWWLEQPGVCSKAEALEKLTEYKQTRTPSCVPFWTSRGFTEEEAIEQISKRARKGAIGALRSVRGNNKSKLEQRIFDQLNDSELDQQAFIGPYSYDIRSRSRKKIIEINGTFWHADPRVYKSSDVVFQNNVASDIWRRDDNKLEYARSKGYDILVVWELDYSRNHAAVIDGIKTFLQEE